MSQEESSSQPTPILDEVPGDETQELQPPQLEEEQRAWQRLEQLILGQVRESGAVGTGWVRDPKRNGILSLTPPQLEELRQQLEQQEEELSRLRLGVVRLLGWAQETD